tara:strand:- start:4368 stop:4988 length:621 start_codon:yes stop_codon:yes gene_type:complete
MEDLISVIVMLICGYAIRYALIFSGQMWAKSFAQTVSFFILPIITFVITKTIYGNIALSLGMIGALSIVRFRHPVKSALELIIYFDLITIGIAASVKNNYAIILGILTVMILVGLKIFNNYLKNNKKQTFYNVSFNEGVELNQIEITSSKKIEEIEKNNNLKSILSDNETNDYIYRLAFEDKDQLKEFKNEVEGLDGLKKIDVNLI